MEKESVKTKIYQMFTFGLDTAQIASEIKLPESEVANYLNNILDEKYEARSRNEPTTKRKPDLATGKTRKGL